ncbi:MAG: hypothetical protein JSU07_00235 [Bacteroidetes bacterium]|nr:hypothetical protein [Bacteroidota bacterium]
MKNIILLIAMLCFFADYSEAQAQKKVLNEADKLIGVNLIKNPGAEKITELNKLINWETNTNDNNYVSNYGHIAGEWDNGCNIKCGLPENAGGNYFRNPADVAPENIKKTITQTIDISRLKDTLKIREIDFIYSAQIAGFHCDEALKCAFGDLKIEYFDSAKQSLKVYDAKKYMNEFHRVDESEGADSRMHKFEKISLSGTIPDNATSAVVTISAEQNCGYTQESPCSATFVFFDNLSLILSKSKKK